MILKAAQTKLDISAQTDLNDYLIRGESIIGTGIYQKS